jgi:hypothetical protein
LIPLLQFGKVESVSLATQVCNRCLSDKPVEAFNWRWKGLGIRQRTCRECQKQQKNNWYARNKETHIANMVQNRQAKMEEGRAYIWNYLSTHSCVECGESDPIVLEFDHIRGRKRMEVTRLVRSGYSIDMIQQEIDKCVVVCANCHKRRTYKGSWRGS